MNIILYFSVGFVSLVCFMILGEILEKYKFVESDEVSHEEILASMCIGALLWPLTWFGVSLFLIIAILYNIAKYSQKAIRNFFTKSKKTIKKTEDNMSAATSSIFDELENKYLWAEDRRGKGFKEIIAMDTHSLKNYIKPDEKIPPPPPPPPPQRPKSTIKKW